MNNCFEKSCIYYTPSTTVDLVGKDFWRPCRSCSRNYRDFYKSTSVPLPTINNKAIKQETSILKNGG